MSGLDLLRKKFPDNQIGLLPKPYKKDSPKGNCSECGGYHGLPAAHLSFVGHAALTDRLLDADPNWTWEPMALDEDGLPKFDKNGGLWIKLTVCGVTRPGYGNASDSSFKEAGAREKEIIGDALRNAAMRFGAALELWHKGDLHLENKFEDEIKSDPKPELKNEWAFKNHQPAADEGSAQAQAFRPYVFPFGSFKNKTPVEVFNNEGREKLENALIKIEERIALNSPYAGSTIEDMYRAKAEIENVIIQFENGEPEL